MDLEQRLRTSLAAPDPGAMFTARVMARLGRGATRRRGSVLLVGGMLAVGAAAAMLAWRMSDIASLPVEVAATSTEPEPVPVAPESVVNAELVVHPSSDADEPAVPAPPPAPAASPGESAPQYSVALMPLRHEGENLTGRDQVEALYSSMLVELRQVPGLTLHVLDDWQLQAGVEADYVLTVSRTAPAIPQSGGGASVGGQGGIQGFDVSIDRDLAGGGFNMATTSLSGAGGDSGSVAWVELKVESRQSAANRYTLPLGTEGAAGGPLCSSPIGALAPQCMTPAQLAASQVEILRLQVFPPDFRFQRYMVEQLGDAGPGQTQGMSAQLLLHMLTADGSSRLDGGTLQALARYAAGQAAEIRAGIWSTLGRVSHPILAELLTESLREDPDRQVRLAALAGLQASYSTIPVVRSAFEEIARNDADTMVRAAVRRALYGPAQWRDDVLVSLHDADLPYEARLAPLIAGRADGVPEQEEALRALLLQEQVLHPLVTLVRQYLGDSGHAQVTGDALRMLGNVDDPAVFDLFTQLMRETRLPVQISAAVGTWAINHRNDPRVRDSLPMAVPMIPSGLAERIGQITEDAALPTRPAQ